MRKNASFYAASVLVALALVSVIAKAATIVYNQALVSQLGLAYSATYPLNLQANGIGALSAQVVYGSATFSSQNFVDGQQSVSSFSIINNAALSTATAANSLTVASTSGLTGASISIPGYVFYNGIDWATQATASQTASSIATALHTAGIVTSQAANSAVIYTTAPTYGRFYNSWQMLSNNSSVTIATPFFMGGQGKAILSINGSQLKFQDNWAPGATAAASATNLAAAINADPILSTLMKASASGSIVYATSTLAGINAFSLVSSTPAALSVSAAAMTGGTAPSAALSGVLSIPNHSLTTALPVLYVANGLSLGGLTDQTTYYAVPLSANTLGLASSSSNAQAGTFIVFTSSTTQLAQHTANLAPLAITGTPGFFWEYSNDGTNWNSIVTSSVSIPSPSTLANTSVLYSFGYIGTAYIRLNVAGPTTGGLKLSVQAVGTN